MNEREYFLTYKRQKYLIRVSPDITTRGGERGVGTTTSVWRVSTDPTLNNENGVIPGVRGYQGRHSRAALLRLLNTARWN